MANKSFYEVLNTNYHTKESLHKLYFKMDTYGPIYSINFGEKYSDPRQSIENDDFIIEMKTPVVKEIIDKEIKKKILSRLIHHDKCF